MAAASRVRGPEYDEMPAYSALPAADGSVQRAHRLLQRSVRVEPVAVEDVDVVHAHPRQRLVQARQEVLARPAALPVRARPHVVARLGGEDQLVAVRAEVLREDRAEVALGAPVRRAVVVGQVEVGDAAVERPPQDGPLGVQRGARRRSCATGRVRSRAGRARCVRSGGRRHRRRRCRTGPGQRGRSSRHLAPCRAKRAGVVPTRREKWRCRWAWSWKPTATATSAMGCPASNRPRAASMRRPVR